MRRYLFPLATAVFAGLAACSGESARPAPDSGAAPAAPTAEAPSAPAPGGKIIAVKLETMEDGTNRFDPAEVEAHQGDLIRFTLVTGVHNVHFLADSNAVKQGLPAASELLQLPGQTYDLLVTLPPGKYYFQCDPHALLGMVGHLKVEAKP